MKIGIISDTHNYLSEKTIKYLSECDEIWHAGDIGSIDILNQLEKISLTRAVFGNIDGEILRRETKEYLIFKIKNIKVLMIHIAGRIEHYNSKTRNLIIENKPDLLICGHSHILKVSKDTKFKLLHINPGAAGKVGFHKEKTIIRFDLLNEKIQNMQVVKLDN
ncbi:MAG: YfcE family phosphodiesterase [Flammeovirgaceae bacterium]|nr:YfcE family phosphodiesterase [Flammeovirgaceae bacterium]|tara:strand:+ start:498 stop:986 length:489 start_codon:yes stop_codon:yes gene_type:complete